MLREVVVYSYYRIYCFYRNWGEDAPHIFANAVVTLVVSSHLFTIVYLLSLYCDFSVKMSYWQYLIIAAMLYLTNYKILVPTFESAKKKWDNESYQNKRIKGLLIGVYVASSIVILFLLVTYIHKSNG